MRVITIGRRKELNKYFDKYGKGGYAASIREFEGDVFVIVRFFKDGSFELLIPFVEMVFYAGFLPPVKKEHTFQDSVDEVRRVAEADRSFYQTHGHMSYEECDRRCKLSVDCDYCNGDGRMWFDKSSWCPRCKGKGFLR